MLAPGLWPIPAAERPGKREIGAERAVAGDPLGLVTHFIPVTTWARLERRPMGRRGGQLLWGTPALPAPDPRAAVRGWNGGPAARGLVPLVAVVPWLGPWWSLGSAWLRASGWSDCAGSRAPRAAPDFPFVNPRLRCSLSPPRLRFLDPFCLRSRSLGSWFRRSGPWSVISNA